MMKLNAGDSGGPSSGRWCAGITIFEMLISMTLAIVLLLSLVMLYYSSAKTAAREENISSASRDGRLITRRMSRDFRLAGLIAPADLDGDSNDICETCEVPGQSWSDGMFDNFEAAATCSVVFVGDVDNDDHTETTSLSLSGDTLIQMQWEWSRVSRSWTGPVRRSLGTRVDRLLFDYYNRDQQRIPDSLTGPPATFPPGGFDLGDGQRRQITGVEVTLVMRSEGEENRIPDHLVLADGTEYNDRFRRAVISFMVRGRNLGLGE